MDPDREWWLRVPAVLLSPRSVFAALRSEEPEDVEARAEPVLALTLLAGIAIALGTSTARHPRWSLDGTHIAFLRGSNGAQLVVTDVDGAIGTTTHGEPLQAIDSDGIEWSPDGRHIALISAGRKSMSRPPESEGGAIYRNG